MTYSETEIGVIVADSLKELNYRQKRLLLESEDGANPEKEKFAAELIKTLGEGVYNKVRAQLYDGAYREKVLSGLRKAGADCVTVKSKLYPPLLLNTPIPPLVLYAKGNLDLLATRAVAVVGSRRTPKAVCEECVKICENLSRRVAVVSGIADGADSSALKGGLAEGKVISVLPFGHGATFNYNRELLKRVEENGLSISELPPKTPALRHLFMLRNRIIAGLAECALVVSAGKKSGALSTARFANDYSRELFAFPYNVGSSQGEGCNRLIKNGARLCDCAEDILFSYGFTAAESVEESADDLDESEKAVLKLLRAEGELHAERIAESLRLPLTDIVTTCSMLEIKGYIVRSGGNSFTAI